MMKNFLMVTLDVINSGFKPEFLDIIGVIAILFGISVIIINNPISSLLCLIGLFSSAAVYFISIGLNFIGFSYLIVYIGAVSILFLFILMLIDIKKTDLTAYNLNSIPLALLVMILLSETWHVISPDYTGLFSNIDSISANLSHFHLLPDFSSMLVSMWDQFNTIMFTVSNNWDGSIVESGHIVSIGQVIYTVYNTWLLLVSLILLLAMVGCIKIVS